MVVHAFTKPHRSTRLARALGAGSLFVLSTAFLAIGAGRPIPSASAQDLFGLWDAPPSYTARKKPTAAARTKAAPEKPQPREEDTASRRAEGPLVVNISLSRQRLTVYDANGPVASAPISSGRAGYATPTGVFTILQKRRMHYSNLYQSAPMPNMQRLTWSGVALHAGALPGYPASHGCIRLPQGFSKKLFGMTKLGTRVVVTRDPVAPKPIAHAGLFTAFPPAEDGAASAVVAQATKVADASGLVVTAAADTATGFEDMAGARALEQRFRERRRAEAGRLLADIRTAGYARAERDIQLVAASKTADAARRALADAREEADRLEEQLGALEASLAEGEAALANLRTAASEPKKHERKADPTDDSKRIARRLTLEDRMARLPREIEAVRDAHVRAQEELQKADAAAREAEISLRAAADALNEAETALKQGLAKEKAAEARDAIRDRPVSVFISRAKQRLYIRQGYDDVLDAPVTIDNQDEPIGTHVFTALDFAENKTDMVWNVVSVPHDPSRKAQRKKAKEASRSAPEHVFDPKAQTAAAALDRITISEDVRAEIADVMKPGSSLVISDLGIGNETGAYTDFIVPIR